MFCALSGISLSWKTLVFGRFTSQERTNVHRTALFLHTPDFSLSKVTALKVVWGKDTSRRSKEPGSDLPSCFSAWAPFCKCGWRHHISRSGCGPDWSNLDLPHSLVFNVLFSGLNFCVGDIKHKNNRKQAWSRVHTSNMMDFILYLAPVPASQIIHPDCDLKTISTFHSSLWGNKQGDPRFFSHAFAKNSLINNIFEEEKKFDSRTWFVWGK